MTTSIKHKSVLFLIRQAFKNSRLCLCQWFICESEKHLCVGKLFDNPFEIFIGNEGR
jgi:hypothetical protein